jgi:hypothetical protein
MSFIAVAARPNFVDERRPDIESRFRQQWEMEYASEIDNWGGYWIRISIISGAGALQPLQSKRYTGRLLDSHLVVSAFPAASSLPEERKNYLAASGQGFAGQIDVPKIPSAFFGVVIL